MKHNYQDIISRIPEEPKWFDHNGTPRYDDFHPKLSPNIYADECVLILIACQNCGRKFQAEMSHDRFEMLRGRGGEPFKSRVPHIYYGDPPNIGCCPSGPTMTSDTLKILQFWSRERFDWERRPDLEVEHEKISDEPITFSGLDHPK